jgi:hypothetical protein
VGGSKWQSARPFVEAESDAQFARAMNMLEKEFIRNSILD